MPSHGLVQQFTCQRWRAQKHQQIPVTGYGPVATRRRWERRLLQQPCKFYERRPRNPDERNSQTPIYSARVKSYTRSLIQRVNLAGGMSDEIIESSYARSSRMGRNARGSLCSAKQATCSERCNDEMGRRRRFDSRSRYSAKPRRGEKLVWLVVVAFSLRGCDSALKTLSDSLVGCARLVSLPQ